jgi:hypothetical protein
MPDPEGNAGRAPERRNLALWFLMGFMALIVVGGLAYGLSQPRIYSENPPQTVGSAASHARAAHPM